MGHALIKRNASTQRKNQNGSDNAPEIDFAAVSEWMSLIWKLFSPAHAINQQKRIYSINKKMDRLALRHRAAIKNCSGKLCCGSEKIADNPGMSNAL